MIYIITALKSEAQAFVDKYKLDKSKSNENLKVLISGIGKENIYKTTLNILSNLKENDSIVNIGICAASHTFHIGDLLEIDLKTQCILGSDKILSCADQAVDESHLYDAVDMESSAFIEATHTIKKRYIFKIVSDHFEPSTVTKEKTKKLIFDKIDEIMEKIDE